MASQQFPTYGRGDEPDEPPREEEHYAKPAPYGPGTYSQGSDLPEYSAPPAQPQYGQPPQYAQPQQYGQPYQQPPAYRPGSPYGAPANPQQHEVPAYGRPQPAAPRDPRIARVLLIAVIISAIYGLLVLSVQRTALREIAQAPGSPLNHPLRTDVIDTIGQLLVLVVGLAALVLWVRDLLSRRKAGHKIDPVELGGLGLVAVGLIPILIWGVIVLSTGMGTIDDSLDRLPTAYGWGGVGLLMLAGGFFLGYHELKPEVSNPVVQAAPDQPPWE